MTNITFPPLTFPDAPPRVPAPRDFWKYGSVPVWHSLHPEYSLSVVNIKARQGKLHPQCLLPTGERLIHADAEITEHGAPPMLIDYPEGTIPLETWAEKYAGDEASRRLLLTRYEKLVAYRPIKGVVMLYDQPPEPVKPTVPPPEIPGLWDVGLTPFLDTLSERRREVIERRFGLNGRVVETLQVIADDYGVTRQRVAQIEQKALKLLNYARIWHEPDMEGE